MQKHPDDKFKAVLFYRFVKIAFVIGFLTTLVFYKNPSDPIANLIKSFAGGVGILSFALLGLSRAYNLLFGQRTVSKAETFVMVLVTLIVTIFLLIVGCISLWDGGLQLMNLLK